MPKQRISASRRGFLVSIGAGGVATAAAVVGAVAPDSASDAKVKQPQKQRGYRLSEHINKYYRTTRV